MTRNLYVHFPFCRRKCSYCALHSRAGTTEDRRRDYVAALVRAVENFRAQGLARLDTIYFGGGSPALCDLRPLLAALRPLLAPAPSPEVTVELHPLDVTPELLRTLRDGGVNRVSMGVQSLDDAILADMGRGYTFTEAERAFVLIREWFDNAGIDLIVGYPGETAALTPRHARLAKWGLKHCSVYSLILEEKSLLAHRLRTKALDESRLPSDDVTLDRLSVMARFLSDLGLERYEISNYAVPGHACRHNLAVWRGEDYLGLGEGAHGRVGLRRTRNDFGGVAVPGLAAPEEETVTPETDAKERRLFRLRTREGLDATGYPAWVPPLDRFVTEGLLTRDGAIYRLTERGAEVCDSILAEII